MKTLIEQHINTIFNSIVDIRRNIHMHPEIAFDEYNTANLIKKFLDNHKIPHRDGIAKTGIMATIQGAKTGKTLLIRADMDALPMTEQNDVEYRSKNNGLMHACGHDAHTAILLGTACIINQMKDKLCGNVKFIFQPAEEDVGGALSMIQEGAMENPQVDACIALHVSPLVDVGEILIKKGEITASPDDFEIRIQGKGGHGASPQDTIDPIAIGCNIVNSLHMIVSRMVDPNTPAVLSIGYFNAGTSPNIIPDYALIGGTARTTNPDLRKKLAQMIENIVAGTTNSMGAEYELHYNFLFPPAINDDNLTDQFILSATKVIGKDNIKPQKSPLMIGEDFAYFGELVPSTLFYLGCKNEDKDIIYPLHSSKFNIDENCMKIGIELFCNFVFEYLNEA